MGKVLATLALVLLGVLAIGTALMPHNAAFWLASGAGSFQLVREALIVIILAQLATRPPRHVIFRVLTGAFAFAVAWWAIAATDSFHMQLLDTLCFLGAAITIGVTSLERRITLPSIYPSNKPQMA